MLSTIISLVVLALALMLCHKWNPFLGSLVCSVLAYYGIKRLLQRKLDSIIEKFSKASTAKCRLPQDAFILPETVAQLVSRLPGRRSEPSGTDVEGVSTCLGLLPQAGEADRHLPSDYISAEVRAFVDNIMSRYIESWYRAVSNNQDFPRALEYIIEDLLRVLRERLASLDACEVLEHMVPVAHAHYRKYRACLIAVERTKRNSCDESCDLLRREAIKKRFHLHHVAFESDAAERNYLRGVTSVLVKLLEPPHLLASPATKALVIDILTNNVLVPTIHRLCEPEWLSWALLYLLSMEEDAEVLCMKKSAGEEEERNAEKGLGTGECPCKGESTSATAVEEGGSGDPPATQYQAASLASLSRVPSWSSVKSGSECLGLPDVYVGTQESSVRVFAGSDGEGAVEEAVEAEVFLGSLVFTDINIERTESRSVPGKGVHTVYCIKYAVCKHNEDRAAPTVEDREVWRRFREFLELQGSLESNRQLRKHLVGIDGPSRGLATVLSDKRNVTKRRKFLNKYLKALCGREAIVNSREFHKFLDYDEDAEKTPEQPVPEMRRQTSSTRLDRVAQGVRTKLGLLKSALPGDDHGSLSPLSPLEGSQVLMSEYLPGDMDYSFAKDSRSEQLGQCIFNFIDNFDQASSPEFSPPHSPGSLPPLPLLPLDRSPSNTSHKSSQGAPSSPEVHFPPMENDVVPLWRGNAPQTPVERLAESLHSDIPLCASAIDFVVDSLEDGHFCKSAQLVLFVQLLLGRPLERVLKEQLAAVFGETNCALYLHRLHERLWGSDSAVETFSEAQVARGLAKAVPVWAQLVFGVDTVCEVARTLAKATQIRDLNRCLVYELMDVLIDCLLAQDNCDARSDDDA